MNITTVMVVRDEEYYLPFSIANAMRNSDTVFVLDTGSVDKTMSILKDAKDKAGGGRLEFEQRDFGGSFSFEGGSFPTTNPRAYREMDARNYALKRAEQLFDPDWMVRLDADETMSKNLFDIMRQEKAPSLRFSADVCGHYGPPLLLFRKNGEWDAHIFAWNRRIGEGRWTHPANEHVCLTGPGFSRPRMISEPVHFHWHRVFGPKCLYTFLWAEMETKAIAAGKQPSGYGRDMAEYPWLTMDNRKNVALYREKLPEYFTSDGRFIVRKIVQNRINGKSMAWPDTVLEADILAAWKSFISYE